MQDASPSGKPDAPITSAATTLAHGGRLQAARRRFPAAPEPFLDLSTGINPVSYPIPAIAPEAWTRLPEPETLAALGAAAAQAYRVADPAMVVPAPGTQILISLLPHLLGHRAATILAPTYGEHANAWRQAGAAIREVGDVDALEHATVAILCNPNNPDGRRIRPPALLALADRLAATGGLLVVDEAFADFDPALSLAPFLPHPALLILRSFGKAYGLAGLRLGFALATPALADHLRTALGPWAISGPAAAIATHALADAPWRDRTAARLRTETDRLDATLRSAGMTPRGGTALFRLAETSDARFHFDRLGRAGILVRRFDDHPAWLRFGLPADHSAWARLETALRT